MIFLIWRSVLMRDPSLSGNSRFDFCVRVRKNSCTRVKFRTDVAPPFPPNGARLDDSGFAHALRNLFPGTPVEAGSQSAEPAAPEKTLVRRVLLDVGSFALFRGIGMMFMIGQQGVANSSVSSASASRKFLKKSGPDSQASRGHLLRSYRIISAVGSCCQPASNARELL
jgi:hypothetical protein